MEIFSGIAIVKILTVLSFNFSKFARDCVPFNLPRNFNHYASTVGSFYAGPYLRSALFTPALIPPGPNFGITAFRAMFYAKYTELREK